MILHGSSFAVYRCDEDRRDEPRGVVRPYRAREIADGLDGTANRGGVVKFGTGYNTISDSEDKVMRAALDAHKETSAPLHAHAELGTLILEQIALVKVEGVDPAPHHRPCRPQSRPWVHRKATETGVFLCFNGISRVKYHPEGVLIDYILKLVVRGHGWRWKDAMTWCESTSRGDG